MDANRKAQAETEAEREEREERERQAAHEAYYYRQAGREYADAYYYDQP